MPITRVAEHHGLHWGTVKDLDKAYLERTLEPAGPGKVRLLMMDESPLHKGQSYATGFADAETRQVLWVGTARGDKVRRESQEKDQTPGR